MDNKTNKPSYDELMRQFNAASITIENLEAQVKQLAAESAGMDAFVDEMLSTAWSGGSADGAEIQELALKNGLIRKEVYSQDAHETLVEDPGNFEDGDAVYFRVETPRTDAFLSRLRNEALPTEIAEIIDSGDLETICYESDRSYAEDFRLALYRFRQLREGKAGEVCGE